MRSYMMQLRWNLPSNIINMAWLSRPGKCMPRRNICLLLSTFGLAAPANMPALPMPALPLSPLSHSSINWKMNQLTACSDDAGQAGPIVYIYTPHFETLFGFALFWSTVSGGFQPVGAETLSHSSASSAHHTTLSL